ncbi:MAG: hypothetical protein ACRBDI_05330 [Alphaproteobacteria bacterium]
MRFYKVRHFLFILAFLFCTDVFAQPELAINIGEEYVARDFSASVDVIDEMTLLSSDAKIKLWGVKKINATTPVFELRARTSLENLIMEQNVFCTSKAMEDSFVKAQCVNVKEEDLGLYLLQNGFVTLNRSEVYGTIYEKPYAEAEKLAQSLQKGVWTLSKFSEGSGETEVQGRDFMRGAFLLVCMFLVAIVLVSIYIMRGFGHVVSMQNQSMDLAAKERDLREREKNVIASMIHAEIRENKPKIDAYLTVYEEMLREVSGGDTPQFMKTGEVVQKQPAVGRSVFDGNTGKLDRLGSRMASEIIHYYARIKTTPDYVEIKPDTPVEKVHDIIQNSVDHARKLEVISTNLLESFCNSSMIEDV